MGTFTRRAYPDAASAKLPETRSEGYAPWVYEANEAWKRSPDLHEQFTGKMRNLGDAIRNLTKPESYKFLAEGFHLMRMQSKATPRRALPTDFQAMRFLGEQLGSGDYVALKGFKQRYEGTLFDKPLDDYSFLSVRAIQGEFERKSITVDTQMKFARQSGRFIRDLPTALERNNLVATVYYLDAVLGIAARHTEL